MKLYFRISASPTLLGMAGTINSDAQPLLLLMSSNDDGKMAREKHFEACKASKGSDCSKDQF